MDEMYQGPYRKNDLRTKRSPSKIVSEAFGFLNNKSYSDKDGVVRIHSSYSDSRLAYMDQSENIGVKLHTDVYIPEDAEEFTIVTSVAKSPQPQHKLQPDEVNADSNSQAFLKHNEGHANARRESLPVMFTTGTAVSNGLNLVNKGEDESHIAKNESSERSVKTANKEEFTIVTFLEDHNKRKANDNVTVPGSNSENKKNAEFKDILEVTGVEKISEKRENRRSVNIDGEVVELRSPGRNSKPILRAPTWRQNQMVVSEAFDFLRDLEGGDTISVIGVSVEDKTDVKRPGEVEKLTDNRKGNDMTGKTDLIKEKHTDVNISAKDVELNQITDSENQVPNKLPENQSGKLNSFGKPYLSPTVASSFENRALNDADYSSNSLEKLSTSTEKDDHLGELGISKLRQRRRSPRKESEDDDDADSSDEDKGVYRESFRKSTWLYVGDSSDVSSKGGNSKESGYISLADLNIKGCDDSVFDDDQESLTSDSPTAKVSHERTDSVSTTVSEGEFRNTFSHVSKRVVKRADSQQEYKRFSSKSYGKI